MYGWGVACEEIFAASWRLYWWPRRAQHWLMCRNLLFSGRFFQYVFQSLEIYFLRVSMRSLAGVGSSGAGCYLAASLTAELASSLPSMPQCDRVHFCLRVSCWLETIFLIVEWVVDSIRFLRSHLRWDEDIVCLRRAPVWLIASWCIWCHIVENSV